MSSSNGHDAEVDLRDQRPAAVAEVVWRRGDRVRRLDGGGAGIVEGRKGGRVLVLWGVMGSVPCRSWEEPAELVFLSAGAPYAPGA